MRCSNTFSPSTDDPFSGMDWMAEKIDLSDFDLDSLMDSCSSDEPPSSPEDLIATLDSQMDLDVHPFDSPIASQLDTLALPLPLPDLLPLPLEPPPVNLAVSPAEEEEEEEEEQQQQAVVMVKTEPLSPPPLCHLELGSEVDVLEVDKNVPILNASVMPSPTGDRPTFTTTTTTSFLVSLNTAGPYVVLLTAKAEPGLIPFQESPSDKTSPAEEAFPPDEASPVTSDCDSDSGIESASSTPPRISSPSPSSSSPSSPSSSAGSSRTKPYSRPEAARADRKSAGGAPPRVVEKKLKKMEQNKTAATRYRPKKRV